MGRKNAGRCGRASAKRTNLRSPGRRPRGIGRGARVKPILAPENDDLLDQVAGTRSVLAFDYDGTLAPIVGSRDLAVMRPSTASLLTRLCTLYPCAVISGRSKTDVAARLGGVPVKYIVGNHGLEDEGELDGFEQRIAEAKPLLEHALADLAGIEI